MTFPDGEIPPPGSLAGMRVVGDEVEREKARGRIGKGIYRVLYSKFNHDPSAAGESAEETMKQARRKTVMYDAQVMGTTPLIKEHHILPQIHRQDSIHYREGPDA